MFDPIIKLWTTAFYCDTGDGVLHSQFAIQWFRETWCDRRPQRQWRWSASRGRYMSQTVDVLRVFHGQDKIGWAPRNRP